MAVYLCIFIQNIVSSISILYGKFTLFFFPRGNNFKVPRLLIGSSCSRSALSKFSALLLDMAMIASIIHHFLDSGLRYLFTALFPSYPESSFLALVLGLLLCGASDIISYPSSCSRCWLTVLVSLSSRYWWVLLFCCCWVRSAVSLCCCCVCCVCCVCAVCCLCCLPI